MLQFAMLVGGNRPFLCVFYRAADVGRVAVEPAQATQGGLPQGVTHGGRIEDVAMAGISRVPS
ncbi:MAG TPA: hypothetical protein VKZ53_06045 [Candidatus Angelobacter sp.]|nr:hypothetical protein [Candidatus Angelobacter sp.]